MLLTLPEMHLDPLWRLTAQCAADPRPEALNLVLGVYSDEDGTCPVLGSVQTAERRLAERALTKEYTSPRGNLAFNAGMARLSLADTDLVDRAVTVQSVGGTGALRIISDLLALTGPERTVYLGTPAYVNHHAILRAAGLRVQEYPIERDGAFDAEPVLEVARTARPGDVILLQGACHNPTGLTMPGAVWQELATIMAARGVVPFIDHAYFGLGDGIDEDFDGMRRMLRIVPEALIALSAAKAWGLYNERTGCAIVLSDDPARADYARGAMEVIARAAYSQAPSHGARVVAEILDDTELRAQWRAELEAMRQRLMTVRTTLADALTARGADPRLQRLRERRGMFLTLPLSAAQMERLRVDDAVYGVPSGRINLAGMPYDRIDALADAIMRAAATPVIDLAGRDAA